MILVTGGAGYIGSHMAVKLADNGYDVVIVDDFSNSNEGILPRINRLAKKEVPAVKLNLCDAEGCERLFSNYLIDGVMHFAAYKSPPESVSEPLKYYENNLISTINILNAMKKRGIKRFIFSSSATVYGAPERVPITEDMPLKATNPYGRTKIIIEDMLRDIYTADNDFRIAILRYFNPIGAHPSGDIGEDPSGIPNNLVPYIAQVAVGLRDALPVTGTDYPTRDGTGIRDYIHIEDLVEGHLAALKRMESTPGILTCNLGTGRGYTVKEVIAAYEKACGKAISVRMAPRRAGDIAECYADASLAEKELGWTARYTLEDMCRHSWNWQSRNPKGYT